MLANSGRTLLTIARSLSAAKRKRSCGKRKRERELFIVSFAADIEPPASEPPASSSKLPAPSHLAAASRPESLLIHYAVARRPTAVLAPEV